MDIYKHDREAQLRSAEKHLQLSCQSGTWTRGLLISNLAPKPLGHVASFGRLLFGCSAVRIQHTPVTVVPPGWSSETEQSRRKQATESQTLKNTTQRTSDQER